MRKDKRTPHAARDTQSAELINARENVSLGRVIGLASGGMVAAALVLGGLGVTAAEASTHASSGQTVSQRPWMYGPNNSCPRPWMYGPC
jgi:hypothetical protein